MAWNGSKNMVNLRSWRGVLQLSIVVASADRLHESYDRSDTFTRSISYTLLADVASQKFYRPLFLIATRDSQIADFAHNAQPTHDERACLVFVLEKNLV